MEQQSLLMETGIVLRVFYHPENGYHGILSHPARQIACSTKIPHPQTCDGMLALFCVTFFALITSHLATKPNIAQAYIIDNKILVRRE